MKTCRHCGRIEPDNVYMCPACDRPLPIRGPSARLLQKAALTLGIPVVVWELMTRLLRV
jgi:hypothetical protein